MRIDLHTHSLASDGTDTPADLVAAAASAGLDVVALTDHDTSAGWEEASAAAQEQGVALVRGMEISTRHRGRPVHLLAYLLDPADPDLTHELARIVDGRGDRLPVMLAALDRHGLTIGPDDVRAANPGTEVLGRPHVADALVAAGYVSSRDEAFEHWLGAGRPAYVDRYAAPLTTMVDVVAAAGGVTVVAHPWGRTGPEGLPPGELEALARRGLAGIEVDHQDHDAATRERLRGIAADLGLVATGSSDYHGTGKTDHDLGCNLTDPAAYEELLARAAQSATTARAAGHDVPQVVGEPGAHR